MQREARTASASRKTTVKVATWPDATSIPLSVLWTVKINGANYGICRQVFWMLKQQKKSCVLSAVPKTLFNHKKLISD